MVRVAGAVSGLCWLVMQGCGGESISDPAAGAGGGAAAAGGSGAAAGQPAVVRECEDAGDCRLFADCCACEALPRDAPAPPSCNVGCSEDACALRNVRPEMIDCVGGRCILGYDCLGSLAPGRRCASVPPNCSPGQVVTGSAGCWGPCTPAPECASVPACADCNPATSVCLRIARRGVPSVHCVEVPPRCQDDRSCACLDAICPGPESTCGEAGPNEILCSCPSC